MLAHSYSKIIHDKSVFQLECKYRYLFSHCMNSNLIKFFEAHFADSQIIHLSNCRKNGKVIKAC